MPIADIAVLLLYFAIVMGIGLSQRSKSGSMEGFALGDRQIAWWAVLASILAAEISAGTFFGTPGEGFRAAELHLRPAHHRLPAGAGGRERGVHPGLLQAQRGEHLRVPRQRASARARAAGLGGLPGHPAPRQRHAAVGADGAARAHLAAGVSRGRPRADGRILAHRRARWSWSRWRPRSTPPSAASAR